MDAGPHRVAQCVVNGLMPLDESLALESLADDHRLEMIAAAGVVAHLDQGAGQPALDPDSVPNREAARGEPQPEARS